MLTGFHKPHKVLLDTLLNWKPFSSGVLFNTGFMANQALLKHLPTSKDLILTDKLIHHSIIQAIQTGSTPFKRYPHLDLCALEKLLQRHKHQYDTVFVVTESVFSMDGDYPDLRKLVELKGEFGFVLILDEAHGTGAFGPTGGGLAEEAGILDEVDILVGTLGKALGSMGAYVLSQNKDIIDYLINFSGELIYSTYLAPSLAASANAAVDIIRGSTRERSELRDHSKWLREALIHSGFRTAGSDSPIVPVITESIQQAIKLKQALLDEGILTSLVRPPTVPAHSPRLRLSLNTSCNRADLENMIHILNKNKL